MISNTATRKYWTRHQYGEGERTRNCLCIHARAFSGLGVIFLQSPQQDAALSHVCEVLLQTNFLTAEYKRGHCLEPSKAGTSNQREARTALCVQPAGSLFPNYFSSFLPQLSPCTNGSKIFLTNGILVLFHAKAQQSYLKVGQKRGGIPRSDPRLLLPLGKGAVSQ